MSTLATDAPRVFETGHDELLNEIPAIANDIIYDGAAVGESSSTGTGRPLVAGDNFMGFATEQCDNSGGSAGDKRIKVKMRGVVQLSITGVDNINDFGDNVYATDDDTFTLTASGASSIGKLIRYNAVTGKGLVYFEAACIRSI